MWDTGKMECVGIETNNSMQNFLNLILQKMSNIHHYL